MPKKYEFTPELIEELRVAYSGRKTALTAALHRLQRKTGWPRHAFMCEARRRGWTSAPRPWTPEELEYLRETAGSLSVRRLARKLHRSFESVQHKAFTLRISLGVREGYTLSDMEAVLGVDHHKIRRWYDRGLLGRAERIGPEFRIAERNVIAFLRNHPSEYSLRRVDERWYKAMLFGEMASTAAWL